MFELLQKLNGAREAGDALQKNFSPEWLLRTAASTAKSWFLDSLARAVNVVEVAAVWRVPEEDAKRQLAALWEHLRRNY